MAHAIYNILSPLSLPGVKTGLLFCQKINSNGRTGPDKNPDADSNKNRFNILLLR